MLCALRVPRVGPCGRWYDWGNNNNNNMHMDIPEKPYAILRRKVSNYFTPYTLKGKD